MNRGIAKTAQVKAIAINQSMMYKFVFITFLAAAIYILTVTASYAQGINTPMGLVICNVVDMVYGNMGRGLITLAIITIGVGATMGKVTWGTALMVGIGCSIVGNAGTVLNLLTGLPYCG